MGFMDEMKKLVKPYAEDEDDDFDDFDAQDEAPAKKSSPSAFDDNSYLNSGSERRSNNKVVNINTTAQLQVVLVKPDRFDNVSEIADVDRAGGADARRADVFFFFGIAGDDAVRDLF